MLSECIRIPVKKTNKIELDRLCQVLFSSVKEILLGGFQLFKRRFFQNLKIKLKELLWRRFKVRVLFCEDALDEATEGLCGDKVPDEVDVVVSVLF